MWPLSSSHFRIPGWESASCRDVWVRLRTELVLDGSEELWLLLGVDTSLVEDTDNLHVVCLGGREGADTLSGDWGKVLEHGLADGSGSY